MALKMHSTMTHVMLVACLFSVLLRTCLCKEQECPLTYLRYSQQHSYCKLKNDRCPIFKSSVGPEEIKQILDLHNTYRNLVATGGESRAGGLPQAADMMQMVWDSELADIAQRRAEQCHYEHDCDDCRRVENFPVGQNIARMDWRCGTDCDTDPEPNWAHVLKMFYSEVDGFDPKYLNSIEFPPGKRIGHFTQMVWSKTWRIGCGYVAFKNKENGYRQLYICNYGPAGNTLNSPVYKIGSPCESCPVNSCCGKTCSSTEYPGLCRMNKNDEVPVYTSPEENFIFYCDFRSTAEDCSYSVIGSDRWTFVKALGGTFMEIVLEGGETTTLKFHKAIPAKEGLCVTFVYTFGPVLNGMQTSGTASVLFIAGNNIWTSTTILPTPRSTEFFTFDYTVGWSYDTLVSVNFSVPVGDPEQFFDIQLVSAKPEECRS